MSAVEIKFSKDTLPLEKEPSAELSLRERVKLRILNTTHTTDEAYLKQFKDDELHELLALHVSAEHGGKVVRIRDRGADRHLYIHEDMSDQDTKEKKEHYYLPNRKADKIRKAILSFLNSKEDTFGNGEGLSALLKGACVQISASAAEHEFGYDLQRKARLNARP